MHWPTYESPPSVVFLDVDGTLLAETTTYLFAKILHRKGMIDRSFLLRAAYHGIQHRFGRLDYGRLLNFGLESISNIPADELRKVAEKNFELLVRPRLYVGVFDHLADLRAKGTPLVLLSSSPAIVIEPLGRYLGCTALLTTPVRIENGHLLGAADGPPCYGEGKLHWATEWAASRGISMDAGAAYADNWSDRALLERVGRAVVVHPRGRLRRLARRRGWDIVRPLRPTSATDRNETDSPGESRCHE